MSDSQTNEPERSWNPPDWSQPAQDCLIKLRDYAEQQLDSEIKWYAKTVRGQRRASRWLRGIALFFSIAGGLVPIARALVVSPGVPDPKGSMAQLQAALPPLDWGQLGYLLLAIAAGVVLFDRFFGFSTSWMRFVTTQIELERIRQNFRLEWIALDQQRAAAVQVPAELLPRYLKLVRTTLILGKEQTIKETRAWISEFQSNLSQFEKEIRNQAEAGKPGAVDITIVDGDKALDGSEILLDALLIERTTGTRASIANVPPGLHKIACRALIKGRTFNVSQMVSVEPGAVTPLELSLGLP